MKIKVMRIIARLNIGGPAIHAIILNEGLSRNGFDTCLITGLPGKEEGDMSYLAEEQGVALTIVPELGRNIKVWADVVAFWKLFKIIRREKPQIVHTHTAKAGVLGRCAAILNGVPVKVHTFHGHVFHDYFSPHTTKMFIFIERLLANFTDRIVVVSERIKEDISTQFKIADKAKVSVIRLGLDLEKFRNNRQPKGMLRRELNIDEKVFLIGIVGRLTAVKNHKLLLEAIRILKEENPRCNARFLIVGDGEMRKDLEEYAAGLDIRDWIYFIGWRKDIAGVYADLDLVALTSLNEGTPLSLIEAMASKKPVVATSVGGVPDLVEHKKTGWLVSSGNAAQLKEAVITLLDDERLREDMGEAASRYVYERYSKERLVKDVEGLYKNLLAQKNIGKS